MTIDEMQRLCDEASLGPWKYDWGNWEVEGPLPERKAICQFYDENGTCSRGDAPADGLFIAASRTLLPKLIAVARAAKVLAEDAYNIDERLVKDVEEALKALEAE